MLGHVGSCKRNSNQDDGLSISACSWARQLGRAVNQFARRGRCRATLELPTSNRDCTGESGFTLCNTVLINRDSVQRIWGWGNIPYRWIQRHWRRGLIERSNSSELHLPIGEVLRRCCGGSNHGRKQMSLRVSSTSNHCCNCEQRQDESESRHGIAPTKADATSSANGCLALCVDGTIVSSEKNFDFIAPVSTLSFRKLFVAVNRRLHQLRHCW